MPTPLSNTQGKVTGGGNLDIDQEGSKATFGFAVNYELGDVAPNGNLTYQDHKANFHLKATSFDLLVIDGNHALFTGTGTLDDGQAVRFNVEINALSKLGLADTLSISIPAVNGYTMTSTLAGGNITIH
jgi:Flp pilus assembly secretin CpaC